MKPNRSHVPLLIFSVVTTLVVVALYIYMFHATSVSVSRAGLARDIVTSEQNDQVAFKTLSDLVSSTAFDRARLASFFVSADNIVSFITAIESLGPQSGTKITIASIDDDLANHAPVGTIGNVHAHVDASGSWSSVIRLLSMVERMGYASSISHVRLTSNSDLKEPSWALSFEVQTLVLVKAVATSTTP